MTAWAGSAEARGREDGQRESGAMRGGLECMRRRTQARVDRRAAGERRRDDVTDAGGDARTSGEDGHERTRVMIYGGVRTTRMAYGRRGKEKLYAQDAERTGGAGVRGGDGGAQRGGRWGGVAWSRRWSRSARRAR